MKGLFSPSQKGHKELAGKQEKETVKQWIDSVSENDLEIGGMIR